MSHLTTTDPDQPVARRSQRIASAVSLVCGLVTIWSIVLGWMGGADPARIFFGLLFATLIGVGLGLLGPGTALSVARMLGARVIQVLLVVIALAFAAWAVTGLSSGANGPHKTVSLLAAAVMFCSWVPLTRLAGR